MRLRLERVARRCPAAAGEQVLPLGREKGQSPWLARLGGTLDQRPRQVEDPFTLVHDGIIG